MKLTQLQKTLIIKAQSKGLSRKAILERLIIQRNTAQSTITEEECFLRSTFKDSVMTVSAYNAKFITVRSNIVTELQHTKFIRSNNTNQISRFANDIFAQINASMESATSYKEFARIMLKSTLQSNDTITFNAPLTNFPVCLKTNKLDKRVIRYKIPGINKQGNVCLLEDTGITDNRKTTSSAVPSIIHSIDAAILLYTKHIFILPMATIHDSFGCHSNDITKLKKCINQTLIKLFEFNVLDDIANQLDYSDTTPPAYDLSPNFCDILIKSEYGFN